MSFVYLLRNKTGDAFKIGVSFDPVQRGAQLPQKLDLEKSLQVSMAGGNAYKVESMLHYLFREYSQSMPFGNGYTEWFVIDAWLDVLAFLDDQKELLGVGDVQAVVLPLPKKCNISAKIKMEEAKQRKEARLVKEQAELMKSRKNCADHNRKVFNQLELIIKNLLADGSFRGVLYIPSSTNPKKINGHLILQGPDGLNRFNRLQKVIRDQFPEGSSIVGASLIPSTKNINRNVFVHSQMQLFGGYCYITDDPITTVDIPALAAYVADNGEFEKWYCSDDKWPCTNEIRKLFWPYILSPKSASFDEVWRLYTEVKERHLSESKACGHR